MDTENRKNVWTNMFMLWVNSNYTLKWIVSGWFAGKANAVPVERTGTGCPYYIPVLYTATVNASDKRNLAVTVSRAQVSGVLSFPALTSASSYFRRCKCLSLPTCRIT